MDINLTDNNIRSNDNIFHRNDIASLFHIADRSISDLCHDNENLLIFPHSIGDSGDRIGDSSILSIKNTSTVDDVSIVTGNIMGFFGVGNLQLKIKSRFDNGRNDYFLHYMLQKVLSFNLFDFSHSSEQEDVFDFAMFMFPYVLKMALRQGMYREYRNFKHNDSKMRGIIDVSRHLSKNVPFIGDVAYSTRNFSCDNDMTQLVRHTIEYLRTNQYGRVVLNVNREMIDNVKSVIEHTPSYKKSERACIISKNLRAKNHPYYTEYRPLQLLCLQILRREEVKYGNGLGEMYGILFDGAWLWEEYINTILWNEGFIHPQNKYGKGGIYLFEDIDADGKSHKSGIRYPDFYKDDFVLDAKYKRMGSYKNVSNADRNDIHQIITYMKSLHASKGGFVAPIQERQVKTPVSTLKGSASTVSIFGIEVIQNVTTYLEFCKCMEANESNFLMDLRSNGC